MVLEGVESILEGANERTSDGNVESTGPEASLTHVLVNEGGDVVGITLETNVTQLVVGFGRTMDINEELVTRVAFEEKSMAIKVQKKNIQTTQPPVMKRT